MNQFIKIKFINDCSSGFTQNYVDYLTNIYTFKYNEGTSFYDLFFWLANKNNIETDVLNDRFLIHLNNKNIKIQLNYLVKNFIKNNSINDELKIFFVAGIPGGSGADINVGVMATIRINPNESIHKYTPHVHIYKNRRISYNYCARIDLNNLTQFKNDKYKINDLFNRRQIKLIYDFLVKYQDKLIHYYISIQNGEFPEPIYINFNGNKCYLK